MHVLNNESGDKHPVSITKIESAEISLLNKTKRFDFNWNKEKTFDVYKLTIDNHDEPIGLLSLQVRPENFAIDIRLLASSKDNIGSLKKYSGIAGCLIAFTCREAFKAGFEGFICLKPKTALKEHYVTKYGFESTKLFLVSEGRNSLKLIKEYYEEEKKS